MKKLYTSAVLAIALLCSETLPAQFNINDSLALVDLYNSTDGPHWKRHQNWLSKKPLDEWYGVFTKHTRVIEIVLGNNYLTGTLPSSFGNLTAMKYLLLEKNKLSGNILLEMGELKQLVYLELSQNLLTGEIPGKFLKLQYLLNLNLSYNQLSGNVPAKFSEMPTLGFLYLSHNQFSGTIPAELANSEKLKVLDLSYNQLSGTISPKFGKLYSPLTGLYLNNNQLTGKIPDEFENLTQCYYLNLSNNNLTGSIPDSLGKCINLYLLDLSNNNLNGAIPSSLSKIFRLAVLNLKNNNLTGTIPPALGNLANIVNLSLSFNHLQGAIPDSFKNFYSLQQFDVRSNRLSGKVPVFFTNFYYIHSINLLENYFTFDGIETLAQHNFDSLKYYAEKNIDIHQNGNVLSVYAGGTLSNNTYKWYNNENLVATIYGDSTYTPTANGNYYVNVTNSIAAELTLFSDTVSYSGAKVSDAITSSITKNNFSIYPNPAKTFTTVSFNALGNVTLRLSDANGNILQTKNIVAAKGVNTTMLNVSGYANGIYFITLIDDKKQTQTLQLNKQ